MLLYIVCVVVAVLETVIMAVVVTVFGVVEVLRVMELVVGWE